MHPLEVAFSSFQPFIFSPKSNFTNSLCIYSLVRLVRPNTEELISRPLVGLSKIRCCSRTAWGPRSLEISWQCSTGHFFLASQMQTASAPQWAFQQDLFWKRSHVFVIKQIHETCSRTNPAGMLIEEWKLYVSVRQEKSDQLSTAK